MQVKCSKGGVGCGLSAEVNFKEAGYFTSGKHHVEGTLRDGDTILLHLTGKWSDAIYTHLPAAPNQLELVWKMNALPSNASKY